MPTQVKLPDGNIAEFPDGMPQAEIERVLSAQYGGGEGSKPDPGTWGQTLYKAAGNTPASAGRFVKDIWSAVTSPIETGKALGNTALGYAQKAVGAEGDERAYADAMNKYFQERYGGVDELKRSVAEDPVGVLGDLSTVFTGVGGGLRGTAAVASKAGATGRALEAAQTVSKVASKAGELADPLNAMVKVGGMGAYPFKKVGGAMLGMGADGAPFSERLYGAALKPSTSLRPEERAAVLRTGIDEKILPTQAGYDKLRALTDDASRQARNLIADRNWLETANLVPPNIDANNMSWPGGPAWEQATRTHGNTVAPSAAKKAIDSVFADFVENYGDQPLTTAKAQDVKQATYKAIQDSYGDLTGPQKEAQKALARGLKDGIAANVPEVADINERLGRMSELSPHVEKAISRTENWNPVGLTSLVGSGTGGGIGAATGGPIGGVIGAGLGMAAGKAVRDPANIARLAFTLDSATKAKQAIARGLGLIPASRQEILWPAYAGRMYEGE